MTTGIYVQSIETFDYSTLISSAFLTDSGNWPKRIHICVQLCTDSDFDLVRIEPLCELSLTALPTERSNVG
jgi:hypothetical protein